MFQEQASSCVPAFKLLANIQHQNVREQGESKALKVRDKAMKTWGKTKKDTDLSDSDESDEKCMTTAR